MKYTKNDLVPGWYRLENNEICTHLSDEWIIYYTNNITKCPYLCNKVFHDSGSFSGTYTFVPVSYKDISKYLPKELKKHYYEIY